MAVLIDIADTVDVLGWVLLVLFVGAVLYGFYKWWTDDSGPFPRWNKRPAFPGKLAQVCSICCRDVIAPPEPGQCLTDAPV